MSKQSTELYEFGAYRLDPAERLLLRGEEQIQLTPKAFDTLVVLVRNGGHLVEKDELMKGVWPDSFVEEGGLTRNISVLRKVLSEEQNGDKFIETISKRGYRFVAPVRTVVVREAETTKEEEVSAAAEANQMPPVVSETETPHADFHATLESAGEKRAQAARRDWSLILKISAALAILVALVGAISTFLNRRSSSDGSPNTEIKSIAVLPFKNLSGGSNDDLLGFGIADALIVKLGNSHQLVVRPTSAVERYAGERQDSLTAGRELQVDFVIEGNVQRDGDRVRVNARLVRVGGERQVWAGNFDERFADIFTLQDRFSDG